MKGIVLSEFVEFLEESLGPDQAQTIIEKSGVQSQGAYSRVGQYDYQELIQFLLRHLQKFLLLGSRLFMEVKLVELTQPMIPAPLFQLLTHF